MEEVYGIVIFHVPLRRLLPDPDRCQVMSWAFRTVTNAMGNASISTCSSCSIIPLQTVKSAA
jgi:hypothetical protein